MQDEHDLVDYILERHRAHQDRESQEFHKALRLAPNIQVCEALLRGEPVPRSQLDPLWAKRYGV